MIIVGTDPTVVETTLCAGGFRCPECVGSLRPWGHGIEREVRCRDRSEWRRPRRSICRPCKTTHMLQPEDTLARRRDTVEVIGAALTAKAKGSGHRRIAADLKVHPATVRGWLRGFARMATAIREFFTRWAHALDPGRNPAEPTGSDFSDALDAIGVVAQMAVRLLGPRPPWQLASVLTRGLLLCNTSSPWVQPV